MKFYVLLLYPLYPWAISTFIALDFFVPNPISKTLDTQTEIGDTAIPVVFGSFLWCADVLNIDIARDLPIQMYWMKVAN